MNNEDRPVKDITAIVTWYSTGKRFGGICGQVVGADGSGPGAKLFFNEDGPTKAAEFAREVRRQDKTTHLQVVEKGTTFVREIIQY